MTDQIRYKLTDADGYTRQGKKGETYWEHGTSRETDGSGNLGSAGWTHVYTDPLLAVLLDPIHSDYGDKSKLIEVIVSGEHKNSHGLNEGWTVVKYSRRKNKPAVTITHRITFAILCAKKVNNDEKWNVWADSWLSGKDRTTEAAAAAAPAVNCYNSLNTYFAGAFAAYTNNIANICAYRSAATASAAAYAGDLDFEALAALARTAIKANRVNVGGLV